MAQLSNLIVTGVSRLLGKLYVNDTVTAPKFVGNLEGKIVGTLVHDKDYTITTADKKTAAYEFNEAGIYTYVASCTMGSSENFFSSTAIILVSAAGTNPKKVVMIGNTDTIPLLSLSGNMLFVTSVNPTTVNLKIYKLRDGA